MMAALKTTKHVHPLAFNRLACTAQRLNYDSNWEINSCIHNLYATLINKCLICRI